MPIACDHLEGYSETIAQGHVKEGHAHTIPLAPFEHLIQAHEYVGRKHGAVGIAHAIVEEIGENVGGIHRGGDPLELPPGFCSQLRAEEGGPCQIGWRAAVRRHGLEFFEGRVDLGHGREGSVRQEAQ